MPQSYRDLIGWQKGFDLALEVYALTSKFPDTEKFGLCSQLRRAAVSVPSNIAEGQQRHSRRDFRRYLRVVRGSLAELETQLLIAQRLSFGEQRALSAALQKCDEVGRIV